MVKYHDDFQAPLELLAKELSSRRLLMRLLRKRIFSGKQATLKEVRALEARIWPDYQVFRQPTDDVLRDGVGIYGFFHAEVGLGQSARRSALSFRANNHPISCHAIPVSHFKDIVPFDATLDLKTSFDTLLLHLNADSLPAVVPMFPAGLLDRRRTIGFWHWELPVFPARWAFAFDLIDEIWVPSQFVAQCIAAATDKPVHVVPHAVPCVFVDQQAARRSLALPRDDFIVLTIFDSNSFPPRKNPVGTIRAFLDAFPRGGSHSVRLVIKVHGKTGRGDAFEEFMRVAKNDDRITVIDEVYMPDQMVLLQNACDVYLSLHRSEGYGLNIAESMAVGKLAIATNYSGNLDFMNEDNSILIPYKMRAVRPDEYIGGQGQWWADADHDAAVDALRFAVEHPAQARTLAQSGMKDIEFYNSFERVGRISIATLNGQRLENDRRPNDSRE